jgi:peptidyl-prolyl cis-trans isomerase SurA
MKSIKIIFSAAVYFVAMAAFGQTEPSKRISIDRIVAKVDNYYVLESDVQKALANSKQQGQEPNKCRGLEQLIVNKLLLAKAEIDSVIVEDKQIDNQLNGRMEYMSKRFGSEKNIVEAYGKSIEALKSELREDIKQQMTSQKMQETITDAVKVTPSEIRKFFNSIPKDSLPYIPAEVELGHIVRFAKVTQAQKEELRSRMVGYKERILKGEDFASMASAYSEDPGSAANGGDLGFAQRGMMVPEFEAAALKLKPNEISDPIDSDFGLHLIQLIEVRGADYHARHILLRPDYKRMDVTEAKRILDSLKTLIDIDSVKFEKAAKDFSEDKNSADAGGLITDPQTGAAKLPLDASMDYALFTRIDTMKIGTISEPIDYRTDDGKTALRILYYKSKTEPHLSNIKDDFEKLNNIVLANKKNKAVDEWFKKAVKDVFIYTEAEYKSCKIYGVGDDDN